MQTRDVGMPSLYVSLSICECRRFVGLRALAARGSTAGGVEIAPRSVRKIGLEISVSTFLLTNAFFLVSGEMQLR